ncbi:glycosyltransferase family 4 protein [Pontibacter korlensis]|uniref:Glycoside hydrolase n=1 Tax=Pontibacter korlensis TaxID=400092 RepID=A0A0E3ZFK2_9BACT|nr:glycosyltransferase family 4 protein [Pontibacter korlensis]AKD04400.1 glycoside hydrolase [Pontibacter korlensis]
MEVLYISRSNSDKPHPFVEEQAAALTKNHGVKIEHFLIRSGGVLGYLKAVNQLADYIKENKTDIIHVHYGLSALVAVISRLILFKSIKIIVTYHGSDINKASERRISLFAARFSSHNIVVSEKMLKYFRHNCTVIPCGVDTDIELNYRECTRKHYGWGNNDFVILFSSSFTREEKDPDFAFKVVDDLKRVSDKSIKFIELKGYTREELTKLMQAADALIMCSKTEGSPQVVKEAILNSLPVISNDVGDVKAICSTADNCFIIPKKVDEYVKCLHFLSQTNPRIKNRLPVIEAFSNRLISTKLFNIYSQTLS